MLLNNPLFTKESLKEAIQTIDNATFTLIYDSNDLEEQIKAGKELKQASWLLALITDHVFDYYPYRYFMNDDDLNECPEYFDWFKGHASIGIQNCIKFAKKNFEVLETVTRDELNSYRIPKRKYEEEEHVIAVLEEVQNNLSEILSLLQKPKKAIDSGKPTSEEIEDLVGLLQGMKDNIWKIIEREQDSEKSKYFLQIVQLYEMYLNPLYMAWQTYKYGWHSDFWEEGESMASYMMFELQAKEIIPRLIMTLNETPNPFSQFERNREISNGLIKVYKHLHTTLNS